MPPVPCARRRPPRCRPSRMPGPRVGRRGEDRTWLRSAAAALVCGLLGTRQRGLRGDPIQIATEPAGVDSRSPLEGGACCACAHELPTQERGQLPDRHAVASDDEGLPLVEPPHDLPALIAQPPLGYVPGHGDFCSTGATTREREERGPSSGCRAERPRGGHRVLPTASCIWFSSRRGGDIAAGHGSATRTRPTEQRRTTVPRRE